MYECPNCAANLKFHVGKQALYCEYCETVIEPYSFQKDRDAMQREEYEVTVFVCPQCGGELLSEDTTAATFCSYCGASTILDSRIRKEKRPKYIIPFSKDRADCVSAYEKMMKHAFFVPKQLKDKKYIERFRGIYMPFWMDNYEFKDKIKFTGSAKTEADRIHTIECMVDAQYKGFVYDASSNFSDNLSSAILPYDTEKKKEFTPAFLSGFYADTNDIDYEIYRNDARELVVEDAINRMKQEKCLADYEINDMQHYGLQQALRFQSANQDFSLFPVWFLSYRRKDRVAYAVMNGQTGKIAADLPVAVHKYLLSSLFLAIPIFLLLNLLPVIKPAGFLMMAAFLSFVCSIVSNVQLSHVIAREGGALDKGRRAKRKKTGEKMPQKKKSVRIMQKISKVMIVLIWILCGMCIYALITIGTACFIRKYDISDIGAALMLFFICPIVTGLLISGVYIGCKKLLSRMTLPEYFMYWKLKLPHLLKPLLGFCIAALILALKPEDTFYCYAGAVLCMVLCGVTFISIIRYHNLLATRKLPQLEKRGGDENV